MRVPNFSPADWLIITVCANQLVRSSGPSTESTKSFCALICCSQLIGGIKSDAPMVAFLNISLQSGAGCSPAPERMTPSLNSNQRPHSSSRAMICAVKLRSLSRLRNDSCRQRWKRSITNSPYRMAESLMVWNVMASSLGTPFSVA